MDFEAEANKALEARASLWEQRKSVTDDANLSDAEKRVRVEKIDADMAAHEARATELVEQGETEKRMADLAKRAGALAKPQARGGDTERSDDLDIEAAFRAIARGDVRGMDITATSAVEQRANANTDTSAYTTDDAAKAGTTVADTFVRQVLESLRETSPILSLVKIVTTASGEPMAWPRKVARPTAGKVAEGAAYPKSGGSFDRFNLGAYKYGGISEASVEMLTDSALALASIIAADLGEAIGEAITADIVSTDDGSTGPEGLLAVVTAGPGALTDGRALTSDDLLALQHSIIEKYRRNAVFLLNDTTALTVRKLKNAVDGNYLWQPSLVAGQPDTLLGRPVVTDPNMPSFTGTSGAKGILFGDFSRYIVRQVRTVTVSRSDEYGWDSDMVAWKGTARYDGGLHDLQAIAALKEDAV